MYKRIIDIENKLDEGMFLFGARPEGRGGVTFKNSGYQKKTVLQEITPPLAKTNNFALASAYFYLNNMVVSGIFPIFAVDIVRFSSTTLDYPISDMCYQAINVYLM